MALPLYIRLDGAVVATQPDDAHDWITIEEAARIVREHNAAAAEHSGLPPKLGDNDMPEDTTTPTTPTRLLRRPEVQALTGLSATTLYDHLARGTFPAAVKLSARTVAWRESEVLAWIDSRQSNRTSKAT